MLEVAFKPWADKHFGRRPWSFNRTRQLLAKIPAAAAPYPVSIVIKIKKKFVIPFEIWIYIYIVYLSYILKFFAQLYIKK